RCFCGTVAFARSTTITHRASLHCWQSVRYTGAIGQTTLRYTPFFLLAVKDRRAVTKISDGTFTISISVSQCEADETALMLLRMGCISRKAQGWWPGGRKNYTKTAPIQFEEFAGVISWWNNREENERAWKVAAIELLESACNLDRKNPRAKEDITHLPPEQLAASILEKERRIAEIVGNIQRLLAKKE